MSSSEAKRRSKALEKLQRQAENEEPLFEFDFGPAVLARLGPIIDTELGIAQSHADALAAAGQPIPAKVRCRWLIDTGADLCVVKHEIAEAAGLKLINASSPLHGMGVDTSGRMYMGRIWLATPSRCSPGLTHNIFVDTIIASGELKTDRIDGLIGRNVLGAFELRYNGKTGTLKMRYLKR